MIAALILAAGSSRRMGRPKLLLQLGGQPLVRRCVGQVQNSRVDDLVVVIGPNPREMEQALAGARARLVQNPDHLTGMASSLRVGLHALHANAEAAVVLLADQPFQGPAVIDALIETYHASGCQIVVPLYVGHRGNPVLFDRALFHELASQKGDQGGRQVVHADPRRVATVSFDSELLQRDLDTWEDYLATRAILGEA